MFHRPLDELLNTNNVVLVRFVFIEIRTAPDKDFIICFTGIIVIVNWFLTEYKQGILFKVFEVEDSLRRLPVGVLIKLWFSFLLLLDYVYVVLHLPDHGGLFHKVDCLQIYKEVVPFVYVSIENMGLGLLTIFEEQLPELCVFFSLAYDLDLMVSLFVLLK